MQLKLTDLEIEILRKLVNGESVAISSQHRVRLELAGVTRESPKGIEVTLTGRGLVRQQLVTTSEAAPQLKPVRDIKLRDVRGRRLPFQRKSVF